MFEALVKDITQKSQTLVNLLLNGEKKKKVLVWTDKDSEALLDNPALWKTKRGGWGGRAGSWATKERKKGLEHQLRCLSYTAEAVVLLARYLAISGNVRQCPVSQQYHQFERPHVSENIYLSPTFRWEDTKGTFFPAHPLERCLNWLLWLYMM